MKPVAKPSTLLSMREAFRRHVELRNLIPPGARILVGYSGGADSTCLLSLLVSCGFDVVAAHLHHGQRGEADRELRLCEAFANDLGVPFAAGHADVPEISRTMKVGLEEAGRHARYEFFRQAAFRLECPLIATAHTRDDFVETVILHMTRGAGLAGLAGIPEIRDRVVRPLLPFSRAQTRAYCDENGLWTHDDPANSDVNFSRARVRLRVLPELRAINPSVDDAIVRLASVADDENRFLDGMAARALEETEVAVNGDLGFVTRDCEVVLRRDHLATLPPVLLARALRLGVQAVGGQLDRDQTALIQSGLVTSEKGAVTAEGGTVVVEWSAENIHIRQVEPVAPFRFPITNPGETESSEFGWVIQASPTPLPDAQYDVRAALSVQLDASKVKGGLNLRSLEEGDRIQPLGFEGTRKISDLLGEARLTLAARRRLPMICDILGVVWVPGVCVADRVRVSEDTDRSLWLRFTNLETRHDPQA